VPEPEFKYRAFLSYSHADTGVATRVHRALESFHIDKDLVNRVTATGAIPKTLRPVFRDRHDFDAGASLGERTASVLDDSAALILLASPHAAHSEYVNEEVRLFKLRHPDRPLVPLIIAGEPDSGEGNACFPPALRFALAPDGAITDTPADVLAADLREKGDGFELALAKVVARLIGLAPDDVYRRASRERRRQNRLRGAVAAVMMVLAIAGGGFYWQSHQQRHTLNEIMALVDKYSVATPAQAAAPEERQSLTQAITAIAEGAATDPRYAKALVLLKAGSPADAEPLLKAVAEEKAARADKNARDAAAAYRNLASIAAVSEPGRAREYYAEAARLDPTDIEGMLYNGLFQEQAKKLDAAQAAYARVIAMAKPGTHDHALIWAKLGTGNIQTQKGNLLAALATYQEVRGIAEGLVNSDPGNAGWQRDLSVSYTNGGDVQMAQGDLSSALSSYQGSLAIMQRLAKSDPGNAGWQRNLAVSYERVGNVQMAQGDLSSALSSYQGSLAIVERLTKSDPGNAGWQRDLAISYGRVGNVQMAQRDLSSALSSYQGSLAIAERLAKSDPGNAGSQRDLSVSYYKVGDVQMAQGNLSSALSSYQGSLAIMLRLAKSDPGKCRLAA
jgi:tetratricopeptide (TPR) repeat protein